MIVGHARTSTSSQARRLSGASCALRGASAPSWSKCRRWTPPPGPSAPPSSTSCGRATRWPSPSSTRQRRQLAHPEPGDRHRHAHGRAHVDGAGSGGRHWARNHAGALARGHRQGQGRGPVHGTHAQSAPRATMCASSRSRTWARQPSPSGSGSGGPASIASSTARKALRSAPEPAKGSKKSLRGSRGLIDSDPSLRLDHDCLDIRPAQAFWIPLETVQNAVGSAFFNSRSSCSASI